MPGLTRMKTSSNDKALQPFIKDEEADNDDVIEDGGDDEDNYKPRPQLPKAQVNMRSLAELMKLLENGTIDVDPEYQREVVWTADRMTGLIDSLMENFYIPPIILNEKRQLAPNGGKPRSTLVCVDGKQRLSSVRAFVKGLIPCHDHRGEKWWFCDAGGGRRRKLLSEETQKHFLNKDFVSFQFTDLLPEQEEDLFARVQMGVQLSAAEKMRASSGPWQELARLFVDDFPIVYSLMKDRARAKDFQLTLSCFSQIIEVMHPTASNGIPTLKTNYAALPKLLSNKGAVDDGIKSHFATAWNTFKDLIEQDPDTFTNANKYLKGVQTFAPIEMVAVTIIISMYSGTRNNRLLLGDIRALREALRETFVDLRMNAPVWKFVWDFIEDLEAVRGAVDGSTVNRRLPEQPPVPGPSNSTAAVSHSSASVSKPTVHRWRLPKTKISLDSQKLITVEGEEGASEPSLEIRSPKRQRTDPGVSGSQPSIIHHPDHTMSQSHSPNGNIAMRGPRSAEHTPTRPLFPPMPTHALPQPATQTSPKDLAPLSATPSSRAPSPQRTRTPSQLLHKSMTPTVAMPPDRATLPPGGPPMHYELPTVPTGGRLPKGYTPYAPEQAHPVRPLQVRQSRVSELNSYRAATAQMCPSAPFTRTSPVGSPATTSFPNHSNMSHSRQSSNGSTTLRAELGAYRPSYADEQWEGIVQSMSPVTPHAVSPAPTVPPLASKTPPAQPRSSQKKRKAVPRPTPAQLDGAIDLTSDTELEQERQDLLSAFRSTAENPPEKLRC